ncbi:hypothetical protein ACFXEL_37425 [Streptomyces sp. NPDC059382]|uniref:hypothetical protein n=1 Tax=Streptomyces sp. NPDC059382 TaxID=3346816 RepID=UPI0036AAECE3
MASYIDLEDPCDDCGADEMDPCDPDCEHYDEERDDNGYTREIEVPSQYEEPVAPGW